MMSAASDGSTSEEGQLFKVHKLWLAVRLTDGPYPYVIAKEGDNSTDDIKNLTLDLFCVLPTLYRWLHNWPSSL